MFIFWSGLPDKQVIIKEEPDDEVLNDAVLVEDDEYDPKDVWRIARPYHGDQLFMRHATISIYLIVILLRIQF